MYNLRYSYILTFLLFQFIGQTLGAGGSITSHSMSGNTITLQLSEDTRWGTNVQSNRSCNTNYHIDYIDGYSDRLNGCTIRISYRTVYIRFDPCINNITKGSVIIFDEDLCRGCTYTVEKDLIEEGISVDMNPFGLIPYVNLDGLFFNITPKPYGHEEEEFNVSYDLGFPPGPSV